MKTPTASPSKTAPKAPTDYTETPPRGMWYEMRGGGDEPFLARWRIKGKKESRAFASAQDRGRFAGAWLERRKSFGELAVNVPPKTVEALEEFKRITGGADLLTVARDWVKWRGIAEGRITLAKACEKYVEAMAGKKLSRDSVTHRDLHLRRLQAGFPDKAALYQLTPDALSDWINGLTDPETGAVMGPTTRHAHRATVNRLLEHAVAARWLETNPMGAVPPPAKDEDETVNTLTVEQTRHLFSINRNALCIGRLALEAFGGLRFTSAARIVAADLDHERQAITFPGPKHKTGRRHYVDGWPDNLWPWIQAAPQACWELPASLYIHQKRAMFEAAKFKGEVDGVVVDEEPMRNVLRHSFATYHVAMNKDASKTAVLLTHRNPSMLYAHYRGRASKADGLAYFEIMP